MDFKILRPVTEDGMAGFNSDNQFVVKSRAPWNPESITLKFPHP